MTITYNLPYGKLVTLTALDPETAAALIVALSKAQDVSNLRVE